MLSPLQPVSHSHFYLSGNVTIHENAAIAAGVILKADPDSRIVIASGVCIGMGVIIHACQGTIEVEAGVTLGAGALVIGTGKIGANACVGSSTTIWNSNIAPLQLVVPGSLIGDTTRQAETDITETDINGTDEQSNTDSVPNEAEENGKVVEQILSVDPPSNPPSSPEEVTSQAESTSYVYPEQKVEPVAPKSAETTGMPIYGKGSITRLLGTLFPSNYSSLPSVQNDHKED